MANLLSGFLDNLQQGLGNPKGNLGDFAHAARLYNAESFKRAPKTKFLYHVVFNIDASATGIDMSQYGTSISMLVKEIELPKFKVAVDTAYQYNRKKQVQTKLEYDPINVVFHDDNEGVITALWSTYYNYYYADSQNAASYTRNAYGTPQQNSGRYGLDNDSSTPFFRSIEIYQLSRQQYKAYRLVNPVITSWQHDKLDNADAAGVMQHTMSIAYESVVYADGYINPGVDPANFATSIYDKQPSPLTIQGGGTVSVLGRGGLLQGITGTIGDIASGNILGAIIKGTNTYKNATKISKEGAREEGFRILKDSLGAIAGINVSGVANTVFPKSGGTGQSIFTPATTPNENYPRNLQNANVQFTNAVNSNPRYYSNAVATVARSAGLPGIPYTAPEVAALNASQRSSALTTISNEYDAGNAKVVGLVNKFVKGLF